MPRPLPRGNGAPRQLPNAGQRDGPRACSTVHDMLTALTRGRAPVAPVHDEVAQGLARLVVGDERGGVAIYRAKLRARLTKRIRVDWSQFLGDLTVITVSVMIGA